jgi:hypothetical protein
MKSHGIGIVNEGIHPDRKWLFSFGAYGWTNVLVIGACSLDDALEAAAGWLAAHAPGHLMTDGSEEYQDLIREACAEHGVTFEDFQQADLSDEIVGDICQTAEQDLTYTESGYLTSYEWGVCEDPTREHILAVQQR